MPNQIWYSPTPLRTFPRIFTAVQAENLQELLAPDFALMNTAYGKTTFSLIFASFPYPIIFVPCHTLTKDEL